MFHSLLKAKGIVVVMMCVYMWHPLVNNTSKCVHGVLTPSWDEDQLVIWGQHTVGQYLYLIWISFMCVQESCSLWRSKLEHIQCSVMQYFKKCLVNRVCKRSPEYCIKMRICKQQVPTWSKFLSYRYMQNRAPYITVIYRTHEGKIFHQLSL